MNIDKVTFFIKGFYHHIICTEIVDEVSRKYDAGQTDANHLRVTWHGIEHLYAYDDPATALADFEEWRREPCERIVLTLDGVEQLGGPLPPTEEALREYEEEGREWAALQVDIQAGKVGWCESCEEWVLKEEIRDHPWGDDERICIDCLAMNGIADPLMEEENE
jgi:hypothetical protein